MTDPDRVGGIRWLEHTNGALTTEQRRSMIRPILRGHAQGVLGRLALATGRRPDRSIDVPLPPDSRMARAAEEVAADQGAAIVGHSYRTWVFGRALASFDAAEGLDDELFYVGCLLHDSGLLEAVAGEDFTLRSASAAAAVVARYRDPGDVDKARDAISAHSTPGASVEADGPEGFYMQAGATCDLGGIRLHHLSSDFVTDTLERYPRAGLADTITALITAEAQAVPTGRFALVRRFGFEPAIRYAPFPR